jgi:hypothetical protein
MNNEVVYNVPASQVGAYQRHRLIVRSRDPLEWIQAFPDDTLADVPYLQLLSLSANLEPLLHWGEGVPVELVVHDPTAEFPSLYGCANLLDRHPVRVSIPLMPGFDQAVRLAVSLQFGVRLRVTQPDAIPIDELRNILHFYLHHSTASQPIDFIHSLFFAFHDEEPVTLWEIQEEDPSLFRYVDDQGKEQLPGRLAQMEFGGDKARCFLDEFKKAALTPESECSACLFFQNCAGYFKWPNPDYRCTGVISLFRLLQDAASELRTDLEQYWKLNEGDQP